METPISTIELIKHPELMDAQTLLTLEKLVEQYPFYQTARLLYLRNLYILHNEKFDSELKKTALYVANRKVLFYMVEAQHYEIEPEHTKEESKQDAASAEANRTVSLINQFLTNTEEDKTPKKEATPIDATKDYAAYLLQMDDIQEDEAQESVPLKGQSLIDDFIDRKPERLVLPEQTEYSPEIEENTENSEDYFTETLAQIYIKQGRYSKAIEIIRKLSLNYPKKNVYFADQLRFLEKLIINNKNK